MSVPMSTALTLRTGRGKTARVTIAPAGLALIERLAGEGQDGRTIAKRLGIAYAVLTKLRKAAPDVADAFESGHAVLADEITHTLLAHARKGNVVAAIFLAKTRLGWRETGPADNSTKVAVQINLPGAMDVKSYAKAITAKVVPDDA